MWRVRKIPRDEAASWTALHRSFKSFRESARKDDGQPVALFLELVGTTHALVYATPSASPFAAADAGWRRSPPPEWSPRLVLLAGDSKAWNDVRLAPGERRATGG
jgi:hypothetical protein